MRGTAVSYIFRGFMQGITPAHAGNRGPHSREPGLRKDHPRTCGEQSRAFGSLSALTGSPPHMRGTVFPLPKISEHGRITPAHAGNSLCGLQDLASCQDHPRTCGEQQLVALLLQLVAGSPPHMRGTVYYEPREDLYHGITPAHAGNSCQQKKPECIV